jgi:hypothetical protein
LRQQVGRRRGLGVVPVAGEDDGPEQRKLHVVLIVELDGAVDVAEGLFVAAQSAELLAAVLIGEAEVLPGAAEARNEALQVVDGRVVLAEGRQGQRTLTC